MKNIMTAMSVKKLARIRVVASSNNFTRVTLATISVSYVDKKASIVLEFANTVR